MAAEYFITLSEAAERVGYTNPATLRQAIRRGSLRGVKMGRDWFTTEMWLANYLIQRQTRRDPRSIKPA